jgi:ubiquitin-conjugating enzyme E2 C
METTTTTTTSENSRLTNNVPLKESAGGKEKGHNEASKRLQRELMELMMQSGGGGKEGISAFPETDNLFRWIGTIEGPKETIYEGLKFKLTLDFTAKYPYVAPVVQFMTTCFHPNIDSEGNICLDILKDKWTALYDVRTVLLSIQSLLNEPNLESPLDPMAASLWSKQVQFKEMMLSKYDGNLEAKTKKQKNSHPHHGHHH